MAEDRNYRGGRSDYETDDLRYRRSEDRDWSDRGRDYRSSGYGQQQGERFSRDWQGASGGRSHSYDEQRGYGQSSGQQGGFGEGQQSGYGQSGYGQSGYGSGQQSSYADYGERGGMGRGEMSQGGGYSTGGYEDWDERGTRSMPRGRGREYGRGYGSYSSYGGYEDERGGMGRGGRGAYSGYGEQGFRSGMSGSGMYGSGGYGGQAGPSRWSSGRPYGGGEHGYGEGGRDFWDRASDEVASWFGDEQAEQRRRMDQHRGRGPKNYTRSDERIKEDVNDRLADDGSLDASDIEVEVSGSEVTLSGQVNNRWDKRRAEDLAESVSGVRHVQNNLRVSQATGSSGTSAGMPGSSTSGRYGSSTSGSTGTGSTSSTGSSTTGSTGSTGTSGSSTRRSEM